MALRWPQDGPVMACNGPRYPQYGPKLAQSGQDAFKMTRDVPKMSHDGPKMNKDGPKVELRRPKTGQKGSDPQRTLTDFIKDVTRMQEAPTDTLFGPGLPGIH